MNSFLEALAAALRSASVYNRNDQAPPVAVLWTERERQWEPLLPRLSPLHPRPLPARAAHQPRPLAPVHGSAHPGR